MNKIALIVENAKENEFWGRVHYDDDLIVESASSVPDLEKKMKKLLHDFHDLNPKEIEFDTQYDIASIFEEKKFLNSAFIAEKTGINKSLMRQYATGKKSPSFERAQQIVYAINQIGKELTSIKLPERGRYKTASSRSSKTAS